MNIKLKNWDEIQKSVEILIKLQRLFKELNFKFFDGIKTVTHQTLFCHYPVPIEKLVNRISLDFEEHKERLLELNFETYDTILDLCDIEEIYINELGEIIKQPDSQWVEVSKKVEYSPETLKKGTTK
jgi:hypothetical protein